MEAVKAYYDGYAFVPTAPVRAKTNQKAIVAILDEVLSDASYERALHAINEMHGMFRGTGASSEDFLARKEYEKSMEL